MRPWFIPLWVVLLAGALTLVTSEENVTSPEVVTSVWPEGDPNRCLEMFQRTNQEVKRFGVIPGLGWDNLRNVEASQAVHYTFHKCKLTNDGRYLIPDNVFTVAIKRSAVQTSAQFLDLSRQTSSVTSSSINSYSGLSFYAHRISGYYSAENLAIKTRQYQLKALTIRAMLQYNRYVAKLQVDPPLSPQFKSRLLSLAGRIELSQHEMAHYEAQLIVRDFGTHVLKSVTAGAALIKDDFIQRETLQSAEYDRTELLGSRSESFRRYCGTSTYDSRSISVDSTDADRTKYDNAVSETSVLALGGPIFDPQNMTVSDWVAKVDSNLVPMDRAGDPLYYLISPHTLPEVPEATAMEVAEYVRKATQAYYEINVIPGCTDQNVMERFNKAANVKDGSCDSETPGGFPFGGSFQTCENKGDDVSDTHDPCKDLIQDNPLTGDSNCPEGYEAKELFKGDKLGTLLSERYCKRCPTHRSRRYCSTTYKQGKASYRAFWCSPIKDQQPSLKFDFGGLYSTTINNMLTEAMNCPEKFTEMKMVDDLTVCGSNDTSSTYSPVPFGGIFTCEKGNPQAEGRKKCPPGFSKQLATVHMGCEIYYCATLRDTTSSTLPALRRPPFMMKPAVPVVEDDKQANNTFIMVDMEAETWMQNQEAINLQQGVGDEQTHATHGLSPGAAAAIAVVCTLVAIVGALAGFVLFKRFQHSKRTDGKELASSGQRSGNSYC